MNERFVILAPPASIAQLARHQLPGPCGSLRLRASTHICVAAESPQDVTSLRLCMLAPCRLAPSLSIESLNSAPLALVLCGCATSR